MKQEHQHKLIKITLKGKSGKYSVFKCVLPACHFVYNTKLCFGYVVICWLCNEPFLMTRKECLQKKPHCKNCTKLSTNPSGKKKEISEQYSILETDVTLSNPKILI